jgi:hypothetical protein
MNDDRLFNLLKDPHVLLEAHAASSAYVMRSAFDESKELSAFAGRTDLAAEIRERIAELAKERGDPVLLSAHLFALELTGAIGEARSAVEQVLRDEALRRDPLAGQFAGQVGARLVGSEDKIALGGHFSPEELGELLRALQRKESLQ